MGPGGLTLSYEWWDRSAVFGPGRDYYTVDFEPFGYDDRTPLAANIPGIITTGNPSASGLPYAIPARRGGDTALNANLGDRFCGNCFSVPKGTGWDFGSQPEGPALTWAQVLANPGVKNQISPYKYSDMNPSQQANHATLTFDQEILPDLFGLGPVNFFADAFYMSRRSQNKYVPGWSPCSACNTPGNTGLTVPTHNPYRPTGVPAGTVVRAHFTVVPHHLPKTDAGTISGQYALGFNFNELPFDWTGSIFFSTSEETSWAFTRNMVNANMLSAAMGNTIASQAASGTSPTHAAYTKPASIPFLNPFCDQEMFRCNSPATLAFISANRDDFSQYNQREFGLNFSGPIFELPGGPLQLAVGAQKLTQHFFFINPTNETSFHTEIMVVGRQYNKQLSGAFFGQINIPVVGENNALPFVEGLLFELGYRYDYYYEAGWVKTPKVAGNWNIGYGFTARGAFGSSFNAAPFGLISNYSGVREPHEMINVPGSRAAALVFDCPAHSAVGIPAGTAQVGSLQHYLNPTCSSSLALREPVGVNLGPSVFALQGLGLEPETSDQWSLGFNFTPPPEGPLAFLNGFAMDVSWWHIQRENLISNISVGEGVNDPASFTANATSLATADAFTSRYIASPNPAQDINHASNASFKAIIDELIATGRASFDPAAIPNIKFLDITSDFNAHGWAEISGIDFDVRYDWDMGEWGAMNVRASGYYELRNRSQDGPGELIDSSYTQVRREDGLVDGANSGHQMQRMRFNLGWTDGFFSVVAGASWRPHRFGGGTPPACFWHPDFGPGSCYPGSPYSPSPANPATPPGHIAQDNQRFAGVYQPSDMFFDLALSYQTGDGPMNPYLQNLRIGLNINNVLNRLPGPIDYDPRTSSGSPRIREGNDFQRTVAVTVTKNW
jgi:hypothetical protein